MSMLRVAEPHELRPVRCLGRRSRVVCSMPALHCGTFHAGQGRRGAWFFWARRGY